MRAVAVKLLAPWVAVCGLAAAAGIQADAGGGVGLELSPSIGIAGAPAVSAEQIRVAQNTASAAYRIDTGDSVSVTVYREPDLSVRDAKVRSDGTIAFPLLGDLHVAGLTSQQLQRLVTERLADGYLKQPNVTVNIERYRLYFIKGEVASPGGYSFVDGLTVEKAIALAGGYTERASKGDVTLVRESAPDEPMKEVPPSTPIQPGDVITVEESFF